METLRSIKCINSGCTLETRDGPTHRDGKVHLHYIMRDAHGAVLFEGSDYGVSPLHAIDSDAALLALLGFLTLKPGDTDSEYFAGYTPAQMAWAQSSVCEFLAADVSIAEEVGGCACGYVWTNTDGWTCSDDIRGNIAEFTVIDHGEDGSQYFPGCGTGDRFKHVVTGVGDTAREALEDALEQMSQEAPQPRPSLLQVNEMLGALTHPDRSAHAELEPHDCETDGCDWNHYVSIRYNVRGED